MGRRFSSPAVGKSRVPRDLVSGRIGTYAQEQESPMSLVSSESKLADAREVAGPDRLFNGLFGGIFFGFLVWFLWGALEIESAKRALLDAGVTPGWFSPKTDLFG